MGDFLFSLKPTFTQGLVLGQLSILVLLALVLKYLFLDSTESPFERSSYHPRLGSDRTTASRGEHDSSTNILPPGAESAEWFGLLLRQVIDVYRSKLRDDLPGPQGDEVARQRIEEFANSIRPAGFLDHITIHSVELGVGAPHLSNARINKQHLSDPPQTEFDIAYMDTMSLSLSTSYLFNYPMASFARLPVSLTISLALFESSIIITPPTSTSPAPVLTIAISPDFTLDLTTTSLMGSRAKLANVPKLHELIQHQVRRVLAARGAWKVVLPYLSTLAEAKREIKKEMSTDYKP